MKCKICNSKINESFLEKIQGTYVKDSDSKKQPICKSCQSKLSMDEIKSKL